MVWFCPWRRVFSVARGKKGCFCPWGPRPLARFLEKGQAVVKTLLYMKCKRILLVALLAAASLCASAQMRDTFVGVGVYKPLYNETGGRLVTTVGYGQFYSSGLGFRAGLQWTSSIADVEHAFGLPLAVAWRSPSRTPSERVYSGAAGAMRGYGYSSLDGAVGSLLAGFLMNLFSDIEFYGGVTPGWIAGTPAPSSKTNVRTPFTLTLDAGMCINYSIWRFDIKLMPAFHFDPIGSLTRSTGTGGAEIPMRWFFSFAGGLAFRF